MATLRFMRTEYLDCRLPILQMSEQPRPVSAKAVRARWGLMAYVSREDAGPVVGESCQVCWTP